MTLHVTLHHLPVVIGFGYLLQQTMYSFFQTTRIHEANNCGYILRLTNHSNQLRIGNSRLAIHLNKDMCVLILRNLLEFLSEDV